MTRRLRLHRGKDGDTGYKGIETTRAPEEDKTYSYHCSFDVANGESFTSTLPFQGVRAPEVHVDSGPGPDQTAISTVQRNTMTNTMVISTPNGVDNDAVARMIMRDRSRRISATRQFPDEITHYEGRASIPETARFDRTGARLPPRPEPIVIERTDYNGDTVTYSYTATLEGAPLNEDQTARTRAHLEQKLDEDIQRGVAPSGRWHESLPLEVLYPPSAQPIQRSYPTAREAMRAFWNRITRHNRSRE